MLRLFTILFTCMIFYAHNLLPMDQSIIPLITPDDKVSSDHDDDPMHLAVERAKAFMDEVLPIHISHFTAKYGDQVVPVEKISKQVADYGMNGRNSNIPWTFKQLSSSLALSYDKTFNLMELWDKSKKDNPHVITLKNVPSKPNKVSYRPNKRLAALFQTNAMKVWNVDVSCTSVMPEAEWPEQDVKLMLCLDDYVVLGHTDGSLGIKNILTNQLTVLKEGEHPINCIADLENGSIAVGYENGHARIYDLSNGICQLCVNNQEPVKSIDYMGDHKVVTASQSGFKVWDIEQKKCTCNYISSKFRRECSFLWIMHLKDGLVGLCRYDQSGEYPMELVDSRDGSYIGLMDLDYCEHREVASNGNLDISKHGKIYEYDLSFARLSNEAFIRAAALLKAKMLEHKIDSPRATRRWTGSCYISRADILDILQEAHKTSL